MNIIFESVTDHQQDVSDTQPKSSPLAIDFFEARQLMLRRLESATSGKTTRAVQNSNRRREPFLHTSAVAEQALYWLISAPALIYLVYLVVGL